MSQILELFKQDFSSLILGIFVIMSGFIAIYEIVCKFLSIFGKPIGIMKQRKADHEILLNTVKNLEELHNKHEEDTKQSIRHDEIIREDLSKLTNTVDDIANKIEIMQKKIDTTEMIKLKDKLLAYYRKYSSIGEWDKFESDVFWELYDQYISHGGNSFVKGTIEPVMRELKIKE